MYYAGFWDKSVNCENVVDHLKKNGVDAITCEQLTTKRDNYRSFKFECDQVYEQKVFNSDVWSKGIVVKRFFVVRGRKDFESDRGQQVSSNNVVVPESASNKGSATTNHDEDVFVKYSWI